MKNDEEWTIGQEQKQRQEIDSLGGRSPNSQATSIPMKAILKIMPAKCNDHQIKASFKDSDDSKIKEMILTFCNGNPAELIFDLEKQLIKLGYRYDLFKQGKWKQLG
jgi:hypothetical protein